MSEFIFRMPRDCPELTYDGLARLLRDKGHRGDALSAHEAEIGTTVTVRWNSGTWHPGQPLPEHPDIDVILYGLRIAVIGPGLVRFPGPDDPHLATTAWISKIVQDNAIGSGAFRIRRRKADGEGPRVSRGRAGLLCIDGNRERPVFGYAEPVSPEKIEDRRRWKWEWQANLTAEQERYAEESRRREALKTCPHPVLGQLYAVDYYDSDSYHWDVMDSTFAETLGYVLDNRAALGSPSYAASPEPGGPYAFAAYAQDRAFLGMHSHLSSALAAIGNLAAQGTPVTTPTEQEN